MSRSPAGLRGKAFTTFSLPPPETVTAKERTLGPGPRWGAELWVREEVPRRPAAGQVSYGLAPG